VLSEHGARLRGGGLASGDVIDRLLVGVGGYLTYRTTEDLERLILQAELPKEHFSITSEPLGVDLVLIGQKPARKADQGGGS
jgi:hypothetical protein